MWQDFHEAFSHEPHSVLGRRLRPYCAYHLLWLKIIESPLLRGGNVTLPDLEAAVRICSSDYGEMPSGLAPRPLQKLRFMILALRYRLADEIAKFAAYANDFNSPPTPDDTDINSTFDGEQLPHEIYLVTALMRLGMSKHEAWMCPLGEAEWYRSVANLHEGKPSNILSGQDREFQAGIKAMREKQKTTAAP